MKPELYNDLKKYAYSSFEYAHAGLYTLLKSDKNFANHMERKYRLTRNSLTAFPLSPLTLHGATS